jgi:hypothetical protein
VYPASPPIVTKPGVTSHRALNCSCLLNQTVLESVSEISLQFQGFPNEAKRLSLSLPQIKQLYLKASIEKCLSIEKGGMSLYRNNLPHYGHRSEP